jgi:hypothetical protein
MSFTCDIYQACIYIVGVVSFLLECYSSQVNTEIYGIEVEDVWALKGTTLVLKGTTSVLGTEDVLTYSK